MLVHGDFHGRNIIMQGSRVQAVLDWEFAGGGIGVDILEVNDEESDRENTLWSREIVHEVGETARKRGWDAKELALLLGSRDPVLGYARTEMFPAE